MSAIEHGLASAIGWVTKPAGAAIATVALAGVVGGGIYAKNWWDGVVAKDQVIANLNLSVTNLNASLRDVEQAAAASRLAFERRETDLQNQINIASSAAEAQRYRAVRLAERIEEIRNVSPDQNGLLAPVLRSALDGVRDDLRGVSPFSVGVGA